MRHSDSTPCACPSSTLQIGFKTFPTRDLLDLPGAAVIATTPSFLLNEDHSDMTDVTQHHSDGGSDAASDVEGDERGTEASAALPPHTQSPHVITPITIRATPSVHIPAADTTPEAGSKRPWWQSLLFKLSPTKGDTPGKARADADAGTPTTPLPDIPKSASRRKQSLFSPARTPTVRQATATARSQGYAEGETVDDRARRLLARYASVVPEDVVIVDLDVNAVSPQAASLDVQLPPRLLFR